MNNIPMKRFLLDTFINSLFKYLKKKILGDIFGVPIVDTV